MLVLKLWSGKKNLIQVNQKPLAKTRGSIIPLFILLVLGFLSLPTINLSAQTNDDCLACHSDNTMTMEKNGREVSIYVNPKVFGHSAHKNLACVSCHVGFNIDNIPHKENIKPIDCKRCHENAATKHPFHPQLLKSSGASMELGVSCKGCHGTHDVISPKVPGSKWSKENLPSSCGECHGDVLEEYVDSRHGKAFKEGIKGAPYCLTCHKEQIVDVTATRDTAQLKIVQEKLCMSCHLDNPDVKSRTALSAGFIKAFEHSVHNSELNKGNGKAANCVNCHTAHSVKNANNPTSTVNKEKIPGTCGQCHTKIEETYDQSIHGVSVLKKGNLDAPVCTDCHGEHNILKVTDPNSPVAFQNLSKQVCSPCHSSVQLSQKYGFSANRFQTFEATYHGLALKGGSASVANCASCHGVHNIKPSSDPTSTVNKANLAKTCGKCHPGANENFTKGNIHLTVTKQKEPLLYWLGTIYIILIVLTIGAMFFHNLMDFIKKAKIKKLKQRGIIKEEKHGHGLYLRMTVNERIQHGSLALSFIVLVITGFMLHFPDAWWVEHIRDLSKDAFEYRSLLHRIAAVVMIAASLYHLYYVAFTKRGRQLIIDMLPRFKDLTDAIGVAKFNLGISKKKPLLDRFSYVEKAEYWALIWGTIVMSVTGIIMWFDNTFIGMLTLLGWDVARTIHYYEAWLAFLAIVVWHFYFIIFNPDIYPMNTAWFKGTLTEEEMADEHPLELQKLKKEENRGESDSADK